MSHVVAQAMIDEYGAIATLRDPLLALITWHARHPQFDSTEIINGFRFLAGQEMKKTIEYIPIDLPWSYHKRAHHVFAIFKRFNLFFSRDVGIFVKYWLPVSSVTDRYCGRVNLRQAYANRDVDTISEAIPREWEYLQESAEILKPFLARQGYDIDKFIW